MKKSQRGWPRNLKSTSSTGRAASNDTPAPAASTLEPEDEPGTQPRIFLLFFLFVKNIYRNFYFANMSSSRPFIRRKEGTAG